MKSSLNLLSLLPLAFAAKLATVHQFPNGTWIENIASTRNSSLLVTVIGRAEVHIINLLPSPPTSSLLTTFPSRNSVTGITELSPNHFAIAVGNLTASNTPVANTSQIWTIDASRTPPQIELARDIPTASMINGITSLDSHTLLMADSWRGNILALDLRTNKYAVALEDESLKANFSHPTLPLGVNGIRYHAPTKYLYYTNTVQNLLGRVAIDPHTAMPRGRFEVIAQGEMIAQPDDFVVRRDGSVVLARPLADQVVCVRGDGKVQVLAEGGLASGGTSVVSGGREGELFVGESGLEGGVVVRGGRVVRMEL
ncbi:hypothetical protein HBI23_183360 [Parastagonospora nodorum]|nr:hypothetical protein HBI12_171700 [Parastagonospora nodorum]KAH5435167.1 hypothetical protein HBI47_078460 [Parastagonospora nodorum]KAH5647110.1 hypothetical protein HBI23_183360 [Parastagonospora nodorum]